MRITSPTGAVHLFPNLPKGVWRDYELRTICGEVFTDSRSKPLAGWTRKNTNKRRLCMRCTR